MVAQTDTVPGVVMFLDGAAFLKTPGSQVLMIVLPFVTKKPPAVLLSTPLLLKFATLTRSVSQLKVHSRIISSGQRIEKVGSFY